MIDEKEFYLRFDQVLPGTSFAVDGFEVDVYFERLSMSGLEEMHRYSIDERLYEYFEFAPFETIQETKAYLEKLLKRMSNENGDRSSMYWFVRRKTDGYLIGTAGLTNLNWARSSIEWGYGIDPERWGQGYIMQIQEILKQYIFEVLQLNRLHGMTMAENGRTISSVLLSGMQHEGTLRQFFCKNGIFHDAWQYGMLSQDYFSAKKTTRLRSRYTLGDVIAVVSSVLEEEIDEESAMCNAFSWDSLSHMAIMVAISEKMGISLSPAETMCATSVKAIAEMIVKKTDKRIDAITLKSAV